MFVDPCIIVQLTQQKIQQDATVYQNLLFHVYLKFNIFWATHAHHQEPKTALVAYGFAYVEGCWMCGFWTLDARNMLSFI
jgi:hypothetical protein